MSCFPRKFLRDKIQPSEYELSAANSTIHTYGYQQLRLDLGLRRDFVWQFVIADVSTAIIGLDFLAHYNLLPDCRKLRLVDNETHRFAPGRKAHSLAQHGVKAILPAKSTPFSDILAEFLEITRPPGLPRVVKHLTQHHIRTSPGPPVSCRLLRLAPAKLRIAKEEFHAMVQAGTARPSDSAWSSPLHLAPKK